jgi:hypothetical protein
VSGDFTKILTDMKTTILIFALLVMAGTAFTQNYNGAIQQAKRDSAQNDAEQQRIQRASADPSAPGPGAAGAAAMDPALQLTLKNISSLQSDFADFSQHDTIDTNRQTSLFNNLTQAARGAKATAPSIQKLAGDLTTAIGGQKQLLLARQTKLAREVHALFNSSHLSATQQQATLTDLQKILADSGCNADAIQNVVADLKVIITETK